MDEFWELTPAEFNGLAEVYYKKKEAEVDLAKASSYWSAVLSRAKKIPDFDRWMNPPKPARLLVGEEAEQRSKEHEEDVALAARLRAEATQREEDG